MMLSAAGLRTLDHKLTQVRSSSAHLNSKASKPLAEQRQHLAPTKLGALLFTLLFVITNAKNGWPTRVILASSLNGDCSQKRQDSSKGAVKF